MSIWYWLLCLELRSGRETQAIFRKK